MNDATAQLKIAFLKELPVINAAIQAEIDALPSLVRPVASHVMSAGGKAGWASLWRKFHNVADAPPMPLPGSPTIGLPPVKVLKPTLK